jgi:hypothetical protein
MKQISSIQKRFLLFLGGCIPMRLLLVLLAKYGNKILLQLMGLFALVIGLGFIIIYIGGYRKTGMETGGNVIWWNNIRPLHSFLYLFFAWSIFYGNTKKAWKILLFDVIIGIVAFIVFHSQQGNFKHLGL